MFKLRKLWAPIIFLIMGWTQAFGESAFQSDWWFGILLGTLSLLAIGKLIGRYLWPTTKFLN